MLDGTMRKSGLLDPGSNQTYQVPPDHHIHVFYINHGGAASKVGNYVARIVFVDKRLIMVTVQMDYLPAQ